MKVVCISDTHGLHHQLRPLPEGDLLIHAGDITEFGTQEEVDHFVSWFHKQPFRYKIFTGGNHDMALEHAPYSYQVGKGLIFLHNKSVNINGLKIYGCPLTPYSMGMAFNSNNEETVMATWQQIPHDTDILITHIPPSGILDSNVGCPMLAEAMQSLQPKLHVFGHIHSGYGRFEDGNITFINASLANEKAIMDMEYRLVNKPVVVDLR